MKNRFILCVTSLAIIVSLSACGGGAGSSSAPPLENPGTPSVVQLFPSHNIALTNGTIAMNAKVFDQNGSPVAGAPVTFTNLSEPFGTIKSALKALGLIKPKVILSSTVKHTNNRGIATITVSSNTEGFATIRAEVNSGAFPRDQKTVLFTSIFPFPTLTPSTPTLTLHASKDGINFDRDVDRHLTIDDNQRFIRADVRDGLGNPAPIGTQVTFGSDEPDNVTFSKNPAFTDQNGQAFTTVTVSKDAFSTIPGVLNITGSATVDGVTAFNVLSLFLNATEIDLTTSRLTASPTTVNVNGTSTITAVVLLKSGGPAPDGTTVNLTSVKVSDLTTPCGSVPLFIQTTGGVATGTFTAPSTPDVCRVTGKVSGQEIGHADITVTGSLGVQPGSQTISGSTGGSANYTISGGLAPYTVTSSNPAVAYDSAPGDGTWSVTASGDSFTVNVAPNTQAAAVTLTVTDSAGRTAAATLTITGPGSLLILPPSVTVVSSTSAQTISFAISGGSSPYIVVSSDPTKAFDSASGDGIWDVPSAGSFIVNIPANVAAGTITLNVFDSIGGTTSATITIIGLPAPPAPAALNVTPSSISLTGLHNDDFTNPAHPTESPSDARDDIKFLITGGTPPYSMFSDNNSVIASQGSDLSGSDFTIADPDSVAASTAVTLTFKDSAGAIKTVTVTVTPAPSSLGINPTTIAVTSGTTVTFNIIGGLAPYTVYSSDLGKAKIEGSDNPLTNFFGTTFSVTTLSTGSVTITVVDFNGKTVTATITINGTDFFLVPSSVTIPVGGEAPFQIFGGTEPFTIFADRPFDVDINYDATVDPRAFSVIGNNPATVTITVRDANSRQTTGTVTIE